MYLSCFPEKKKSSQILFVHALTAYGQLTKNADEIIKVISSFYTYYGYSIYVYYYYLYSTYFAPFLHSPRQDTPSCYHYFENTLIPQYTATTTSSFSETFRSQDCFPRFLYYYYKLSSTIVFGLVLYVYSTV